MAVVVAAAVAVVAVFVVFVVFAAAVAVADADADAIYLVVHFYPCLASPAIPRCSRNQTYYTKTNCLHHY